MSSKMSLVIFTYLCTHALRAPPPFAWPSNFVMITEATSTLSPKARAYHNTRYILDTELGTDIILKI